MNDTNTERRFWRPQILGTTALGALAGASVLSSPARAAAQAVGAAPSDLPDLTIKEVKVYVLDRKLMPGSAPSVVTGSARGQGTFAKMTVKIERSAPPEFSL